MQEIVYFCSKLRFGKYRFSIYNEILCTICAFSFALFHGVQKQAR